MNNFSTFKIKISPSIGEVSCMLNLPESASHLILLAHGAGAGMEHPFMKKLAEELGDQGLATLRYQFPYMEQGKKHTDKPETAHQTIRSVLLEAKNMVKGLSIYLAGKSYGGRMSSQAVSNGSVQGVHGIVFYGFPLHATGQPSVERGEHLFGVEVPMLFCQGTRDKLADIDLMGDLISKLGDNAELHMVQEGDHSFKVPRSLGITQNEVIRNLALKTKEWIVNKA